MLRQLVIVAALGGLVAAPAQAQFSRVLLMPGVTYERQVQFTSHGPVAIHVLTAPRPGGLWTLRPHASKGVAQGRERLTLMQRALSREATVAGVNGDLFSVPDGRPHGILMRSRLLLTPPHPDRSSIGFAADGTLRVERLQFFGTWHGTGQRRPLTVNALPGPNGVALFTPAWGPATPAVPGALVAVLRLPPAHVNGDLAGAVLGVAQEGPQEIPPDGAVLVARGTGAQRLAEEAPPGTAVTIRLLLSPDWPDVPDALGGGPLLVRAGRPVFRHGELFPAGALARGPRTAVGQLADGRILLVVADGGRRGYSVGMTTFDLAQTLVRLGAVTAAALDGGDSAAMAFDGRLLSRPSDPSGERALANALLVEYAGVYAPPPAEEVLSPNGDGVAEVQALAYKLPRPAAVTVDLVGPGGERRRLDEGPKEAGVHRFAWTGATAEGAPAAEGRWRLEVAAVDDVGRSSTAERVFSLNRTLGGLSVAPAVARFGGARPGLRATFTLARPAQVTVRVETRSGALVAVAAQQRLAAGTRTISWRGRSGGRLIRRGNYVLRVVAVNEVGRAELARPFAARR